MAYSYKNINPLNELYLKNKSGSNQEWDFLSNEKKNVKKI